MVLKHDQGWGPHGLAILGEQPIQGRMDKKSGREHTDERGKEQIRGGKEELGTYREAMRVVQAEILLQLAHTMGFLAVLVQPVGARLHPEHKTLWY